MKKLLFFAVFLFAIMSYGGKNAVVAHADTLSPDQSATLQQTLEVLKAKLVNLQMQAGQIPQGDNSAASVTPSVSQAPAPAQTGTGISSADSAAIGTSLSALVTALSNLNVTISQHPEVVTTNKQQIAAVLGGMVNTLATINGKLAGNNNGIAAATPTRNPSQGVSGSGATGVATAPSPAPVAIANPAPAPATPSPAAMSPSTQGTPAAVTPVANVTPAADNSAQTANVFSSAWGFVKAHWPTFTIILLVIAILLILFWPQKEEEMRNAPRASVKPVQPPSRVTVSSTPSQVNVSVSTPPAASTPVSTVVAAPAQKVDVQVQAMKAKKPAF